MGLSDMGNTEIIEKMVSIIIPVYNAQEYLGYCLNSIVSQTYQQIEIILVNDGSTDNSLTICENYAGLDSRVSVITIENSGVSNARNAGLDAAKGEYIQFVDSDDIIRSDMVEDFVNFMETYHMDLVVCGFEMITLGQDIYNRQITPFTSDIMGAECVLTREMFFDRMAFILWRTTTLECSWNKIFRRRIIEDKHIRFPENISLGEDFCFNMDYFRYINGVVFTNKKYYYYMQSNQAALTRKYRPDLFENQMNLIHRFHHLIEDYVQMSENEQKELAEYTVSKMMSSLYNLTSERCDLSDLQKKGEIAKIVNDDFVRHAYKRAVYMEPRYEWIRECMEFSDIQKIYDYLFGVKEEMPDIEADVIEQVQDDMETAEPQKVGRPYRKPWWLKQILINICNVILKIHHIKFIEMIRNSLEIRSIKKTAVKCFLKLIGKSQGYDEVEVL
jgi:glycosyltransferase involved in cell wall biosynthesis